MDVVNKILNHAPSHWDVLDASLYRERYVLIEVHISSAECRSIYDQISTLGHRESYVKRIQNPFQLGLFNVMKEKRRQEGRRSESKTGYHIVYESDLDTALKYWLDYRRYKSPINHQSTGTKHTKFFTNIDAALMAFPANRSARKCVIQCQILIDSDSNFDVESQADFCPTYVICFSNDDYSHVQNYNIF